MFLATAARPHALDLHLYFALYLVRVLEVSYEMFVAWHVCVLAQLPARKVRHVGAWIRWTYVKQHV